MLPAREVPVLTERQRARFWKYVNQRGPDECWTWESFTNNRGYGMFAANYKMFLAHRVSWELTNGVIPEGRLVLHRCDVRACVNPSHLFTGSARDNTQDMIRKGRRVQFKGTGEANPRAKLTEADVHRLRDLEQRGLLHSRSEAERLGVSQATIRDVATYRSWRHLATSATS